MDDLPPKDLFLQSVARCTASAAFIPAFYDRFTSASEEIRAKFRFTDFEQQNKALKRSLEMCAFAIAGTPEALAELTARAKTHDRDHLNIEPRFYDIWVDTIIETAAEYDDQWSDAIEAAWRRVLSHVVKHMIRKY